MKARAWVQRKGIKRFLGLMLIVVFILQLTLLTACAVNTVSSTVVVSCTVVSVIEVSFNPGVGVAVKSSGVYQIQFVDGILTIVPL